MPASSTDTHYDILVIGAGIHGAAVARHAALEGYSVCIIEQFPQPAMATSCRSSKLIHGGLRYLESLQFGLVRECLRERNILLNTAPALVRLEKFYIPVYRHSRRPAWLIRLGLTFYWLLGGGRFRSLARKEWSSLDGLSVDDLVTVFEYHDGVTDDASLTRAILNDALQHGAELKTSCKALQYLLGSEKVSVTLEDNSILSAKLLINAAGPWINTVLENTQPRQPAASVELVQGTHIVIPGQLKQGVYYFEADDGRVLFAIPWYQQILLGTTETMLHNQPQITSPLDSEIDYLLRNWNRCFNQNLQATDIIDSFAGLRVLPGTNRSTKTSAFNRARDTRLIFDDDSRPCLITIAGGKLTAHRATAARVMKQVHDRLKPVRRINTAQSRLPDS